MVVHNGCWQMGSRETPDGLLMDSRWTPDTVPGVYLDSRWSPSGCVAQCNYLQLCVPQTLTKALKKLKDQTGYIGFIVLGGPNGQRGGQIKMLS